MLIELQPPFTSSWVRGYLRTETTGRKYLSLVDMFGKQTSISYARYAMCVHLGYMVDPELEVDHRDDDKTNDDINNLQILTKEENLLKQQWNYIQNVQECYGFECAWCTTYFILTKREINMRLAQNVVMAFCSRSCGGSYNHYNRSISTASFIKGNTPHGVTLEQISEMKQLKSSGMTSTQVGEKMNLHRVTISRNWNK